MSPALVTCTGTAPALRLGTTTLICVELTYCMYAGLPPTITLTPPICVGSWLFLIDAPQSATMGARLAP